MAKFVIAGRSNCPNYAKAELLGDQLERNLPNFKIHKIVIEPKMWNDWLNEICRKNNWKHAKSPIIWRELVDRGGKGMLVGDANDFQEYVFKYYGKISDLMSDDLRKISAENEKTYEIIEEENRKLKANIKPLQVTISYPHSVIAYYIVNEILSGEVFGQQNEIALRLYSTNSNDSHLQGLKMEIEDLASSKLRSVEIVNTAADAFTNSDFIILLDELVQNEDNDKFCEEFYNPYTRIAKEIDQHAKTTCKILITPFESRSEIYAICHGFSRHLKNLDFKKCLMGNSMCNEMIAKAVLANRLRVNPAFVSNVIVVGQNLTNSYYIDLSQSKVTDYDGAVWAKTNTHWLNLVSMVADKDWIKKDFIISVADRNSRMEKSSTKQTMLTFAQSIVILCKLWSESNESAESENRNIYSAIIYAKGAYSIREDVFMSVPVQFNNGQYEIVSNFKVQPSIMEELVKDTARKISENISESNEDKYVKHLHQTAPQSFSRVKYD